MSSAGPAGAALFQHVGSVPGVRYPAHAPQPVGQAAAAVPVVQVQAAVGAKKSPPLEVDPSPEPSSAARIKDLLRAFSSLNDSFLHLLIAFCAVLFFREKQLKKLKAGKERIDLKAKDQASKLADLKKSAKTLKKSNSALKGASKTKDVQVADLQDKIEKAQGRINTLEGRTGKFAPSALYDSRRELDFPKLSINKNTEGGRGQARRRT